MNHPFPNADLEQTFDGFDGAASAGLLELRALILDTAREDSRIGMIHETLKWGQPAYLTPETKSGTTVRISTHKSACFALFVHCQTSVVSDYRAAFPAKDRFDGKRAILFDDATQIDPMRHGWFIHRALTYHL